MKVRNLESGEIETLRHGPATEAVTAGTHEFVNVDGDGEVKDPEADPDDDVEDLDAKTKDELVALAKERGVQHASSATKADIISALNGAG